MDKRLVHWRMLAFWGLFLLALIALFWSYGRLDIAFSRNFFDPENVHRFPLMYDPILRFIQKSVDWVVYALVIGLVALLVSQHFFGRGAYWGLCKKKAGFLLLALVLGPGIMVQLATKEVFERPRPVHTKEFTGEYEFVPPLVIGKDEGKSFVSGHAAMGFYLVAFAFLLNSPRKSLSLYLFGLALGLTLGGCRVVQGRHFLSDILFSGVFTLILIHISYLWVYTRSLAQNRQDV